MLLSRKYKLSIDSPCHESWDKMHPASNGRFCDSCAKSVVDFSVMTENEIAAYFRNKPANICGRFRAGQLQKEYICRPHIKIPFRKRFFSYLISFFVSNAVVNKASARTGTITVAEKDTVSAMLPDTTVEVVMGDTILSDSLALVQNDTTVADSLPKITWNWEAGNTDSVKVEPFVFIETVISGCVGYAPPEEKSLIDICKVKVKDSLNRYFNPPATVKQENAPVPKKKPVKKDEEPLTAVLPEEVRRKLED